LVLRSPFGRTKALGRFQASHRLRQFPFVQPRETESGRRDRRAVEGVSPSGIPEDAVPDGAPRPRVDVDSCAQPHPQRHPAGPCRRRGRGCRGVANGADSVEPLLRRQRIRSRHVRSRGDRADRCRAGGIRRTGTSRRTGTGVV